MNTSPISLNTPISANQQHQQEDKSLKSNNALQKIICNTCKKEDAQAKLCSRCKQIRYCSTICQKEDWSFHKTICKPVPKVIASFASDQLNLNYEEINGQTIPVYSPKHEALSTTKFFKIGDACGLIMQEQIECVERLILKKVKENPGLLGRDIIIPSITLIKSINHDHAVITERAKQEGTEHILPICDMATNLALKFFTEKKQILLPTQGESLKKALIDLKIESELFIYKQSEFGFEHTIEPFKITKEDLAPFGVKEHEVQIIPTNFSCARFALLKAGETRAKEFLFDNSRPDFVFNNTLNLLEKWNYKPVEIPVYGDIALYFNQQEVVHVVVYVGNNEVLSKHGTQNPSICKHKVFDTPHDYGKKVVFFHQT